MRLLRVQAEELKGLGHGVGETQGRVRGGKRGGAECYRDSVRSAASGTCDGAAGHMCDAKVQCAGRSNVAVASRVTRARASRTRVARRRTPHNALL
eukprot:3055838-Rhodomonas_salina.1